MGDNLPALVPGFKPPTMPTVEVFSRTLAIKHYESGAIDWNVYIGPNRLIPIDRCNAILAELAAASVPATRAQAAAAATFLIGAYRAADLNDPRIFTRILAVTLEEYPAEIAMRAVDDLTRTSKWLPSRAELIDACQKRMDERRYAEHVVRKHLDEHAERERCREAERQRLARRAEHYGGEPWLRLVDHYGVLIPALRNAPNIDSTVERLCTEFGAIQVEVWLVEIGNGPADQMPRDWYVLNKALTPRVTAARQARAAELEPKP